MTIFLQGLLPKSGYLGVLNGGRIARRGSLVLQRKLLSMNGGKSGDCKNEEPKAKREQHVVIEFEQRLMICKGCEHSMDIVRGFPTICRECGCSIQAKAFFESLHCPIGKW
mmetsp:Transcript_44345/g.70963  ORF Transcript_44345/g.70963 Transcript_44345/m.70963 type:complete len:111 (+) Transcript_44345:153-485(+)